MANMRSTSVTIAELRDHLSAHLRRVRSGQEIVVLDRTRPVARIVAYEPMEPDDTLRDLVSRGLARAPAAEMDWAAFDRMPRATVRGNALLEVLLADRDEEAR